MTFGLRFDQYDNSDPIPENPAFLARNGYSNTENLDGKDLILPRIGFNWNATDRLTVRGGVGQFLIATSSWIVIMRIVALYGSAAIAAYTIALRLIEFVFLPAWFLLQGFGNHGLWFAFTLFMASRGIGMHLGYRRA